MPYDNETGIWYEDDAYSSESMTVAEAQARLAEDEQILAQGGTEALADRNTQERYDEIDAFNAAYDAAQEAARQAALSGNKIGGTPYGQPIPKNAGYAYPLNIGLAGLQNRGLPSGTPPGNPNVGAGGLMDRLQTTQNSQSQLLGLARTNRLFVGSLNGTSADMVMQAIKSLGAGYSNQELLAKLAAPDFNLAIAQATGMNVTDVKNITQKVISTGLSGLLMAITGNFPVAAMGYFAADRLFSSSGKAEFNGWLAGEASFDGVPIAPFGIEIPNGLPNEIFADFRFINYDRLSGRWFPSDEVQPLTYDSNENFRWFTLDRVDGKVYHCNWIKKPPRIFV